MASILDFFGTIFRFLLSIIHGIVWAVSNLPRFAVTIAQVFVYCPSFVVALLGLCLSLYIVFAVVRML